MHQLNRILSLLGVVAMLFSTNAIADGDHSKLHDNMEEMQDYYRTLSRGIRMATPESTPELLEATRKLQLLALESKALEPDMIAEAPEADRAKLIRDYQLRMIATVKAALDLEVALINGDMGQANESFEQLKQDRRLGHQEFKVDD
ncbi:MAG: hypothetical protein ACQKBV_13845 [Puniceicoccales bacterium]